MAKKRKKPPSTSLAPIHNEAERMGAPTSYKPHYPDLAYKFALLGASDEQMASHFNISIATLYNWKAKYPDFLEAIKQGGLPADAEIAHSTYQAAKGYTYTKRKVKYAVTIDKDGIERKVPIEENEEEVIVPPDARLARMWNFNRHRDKWNTMGNAGDMHIKEAKLEIEKAHQRMAEEKAAFEREMALQRLELEKMRVEIYRAKTEVDADDKKNLEESLKAIQSLSELLKNPQPNRSLDDE